MKARWEEVALLDVVHVYQPKTIAKKRLVEGGAYPVFGANGQIGLHDEYNHEEPQLVMGCRGSVGELHLTPAKTWINGNAMVVQCDYEKVTRSFIQHFLSLPAVLNDAISGSAQPQITRKSLGSLTLSLPPLEEQKRIVAVLDAAFAKLDRARANVEANLADAEELYASCLDGIVDDFCENDRVAITEVCAFKGGSQPPKKNFVKTPRKGFVRLLQIRDYETDEKAVYVDRNLVTKFCEKDDVMIGRYGASVGRILTGKEGAYNVALVRTIPDTQKLSKTFLFYYLQSRYFQSRLLSKSERGAQNGFNKGDLSQISIPLLPLDQQQTVVETMSAVRKKSNTISEKCEAQLADLDALRQSLLQRAFAGELT